MSLALFLRSVPAIARRHEGIYQMARELEPVLAPYATAVDLVDALAPESGVPVTERRAVVAWLLRRQSTGRHPLWHALLAHAFRPMLCGLRRRLRAAEDPDSRVVLAFTEVVADMRPPAESAVFVAVRRAMVRALFPRVAGELEVVPLDEETYASTPHAGPSPFTVCLAHEIADRLAQATGDPHVARALVGLAATTRRQRRAVAALRADEER